MIGVIRGYQVSGISEQYYLDAIKLLAKYGMMVQAGQEITKILSPDMMSGSS